MSNVAIFHIPDSLDFNFFKVKSSRDTNICRKFKRQGVWTELKSNFVFSDNPSQNTLRVIHEIK